MMGRRSSSRARRNVTRYVAEAAPPPHLLRSLVESSGMMPSEVLASSCQLTTMERTPKRARVAHAPRPSCICAVKQPTEAALEVFSEPAMWVCKVCGSTDGVWVCLACGHVGCGQLAAHPVLGGGHAKMHHFASGDGHSHSFDAVSRALLCHRCDAPVLDEPNWLQRVRDVVLEAERRPPSLEDEERQLPRAEPTTPLVAPPGLAGLCNLGEEGREQYQRKVHVVAHLRTTSISRRVHTYMCAQATRAT